MIKFVDIVFGLCWGDEGKGKVSYNLVQDYDCVCRWNGGSNAGHTVYIEDKKFKTHLVPCGIFKNKKSIIGPNCVINLNKFYEEISYLEKEGFDTSLIKVSPRTHVVTENHIKYDLEYLKPKLGTTGQGIAPAYADKMLRRGKLAKDLIDKKYIWDEKLSGRILCEGAQSFWLDINFGNYPYVTSSETLPYSACSLGFSPKLINNIIGVAKIYDTKSGVDPLFPETLFDDSDLNKIAEEGEEIGTTTGRKRLVNWLNLNKLIQAIEISGCTRVIINKCDILKKLNLYKVYIDNKLLSFSSFNDLNQVISNYIFGKQIRWLNNITFSEDKNFI